MRTEANSIFMESWARERPLFRLWATKSMLREGRLYALGMYSILSNPGSEDRFYDVEILSMTNIQRLEPLMNQRILELCDTLKHRFVCSGQSFDLADWAR